MAKYEMLSGPFIGQIVDEGTVYIADQSFDQLDEDMQERVKIFAVDHGITNLEDAIERYENSWESVEVED